MTLTQPDRWLTLDTPLGTDVLVPTSVSGVEGISRLFSFDIAALSSQQVIAPADLLGKTVTLSMARPGGVRRIVSGIVTAFSGGFLTRSNYRLFHLNVAPQAWTMQRSSDYKVYQQQSASDIIQALLGEAGVTFKSSLTASYTARDYCIQFGETDLAFCERLMAEEGIFYYFTHEAGTHTMVLADAATAYGDCAQADVNYRQDVWDTADAVHAFHTGAALVDTKWTAADYDFEAPATQLRETSTSSLAFASGKSWEHFHYPSGSTVVGDLTHFAKDAVDAAEALHEVATGDGTCASFTPGLRFTLAEHPVASLAGSQYALTEVRHEAQDRAHFTLRPGTEGKPFYRNSFSAIPSARIARPSLPRPKPIVRGPLTGLVVGPAGEEIHTDKYGRIRVQFPWDRVGAKDETSSCFIHVMQSMAGKNWGSVFVPRIGMEVVVHFLDGDPDRPLVTGAVYNGTNLPPWALPDTKTKSGFLSRSTLSGEKANANELSFDDKKGSELVLFHAEKDFTREVENDDVLDVGHDQTRTVKNNRTTTISEGNDTFTVSKGNRAETISQGNETLTISQGNRTETISMGNDSLELGQGNRTVTLKTGNDTLTLSLGDHTTKADVGSITLDAMTKITLKVGSSKIELSQSGVTIEGLQVEVKGTAKASTTAPITEVTGSGMLKLAGGIIKIN